MPQFSDMATGLKKSVKSTFSPSRLIYKKDKVMINDVQWQRWNELFWTHLSPPARSTLPSTLLLSLVLVITANTMSQSGFFKLLQSGEHKPSGGKLVQADCVFFGPNNE